MILRFQRELAAEVLRHDHNHRESLAIEVELQKAAVDRIQNIRVSLPLRCSECRNQLPPTRIDSNSSDQRAKRAVNRAFRWRSGIDTP